MAEETTIILADLQIKTDQAVGRIAQLKAQQDDLRKSTKELEKDFDKNAEAIALNSLKMKELSREEQVLNKVVADNQKATKSQTGSIDQQRAQLAILTKQYNALSKEERENTKAGQALQKQIKGISDGLKEQEKAVGDTRRNVGNYSESIKDAFDKMGLLDGAFGQFANNLSTKVNGAITIAKASFGSFSGAIKGGLVAALALAVASLTSFFKATGEGEDMLERFTARAKGFGQGVVQNLANAGKAARDAFQNNNGFTSGLKAMKAFNDYMTSSEATNAIKASVDGAEKQVVALQAIEDAERAARVEASRRRLEIDKLLLTVKDQNLTDEQQIDNLEKVKKLEVDLTKQQIEFAKVRLANAEAAVALVKDPTDELLDAVADAKVALNELQGQSDLVLQQANNRISAQLEQQRLKAEADRKARLEGVKGEAEYEFKIRTEASKNQYIELDKQDLQHRLDSLVALNQDELSRTKLKRDYLEQQYEDLKKFGKDTNEVERQIAETNVEIARANIQKEIELQNTKFRALSELGNSLVSLNRIIAGSNADATEYGKVLAVVQIGIAAAQTIGNAISSAKGLTGFDYVAQIAIASAAALSAIAEAKAVFDQVPDIPKPEFYDGGVGYTGDGNPREESTALGPKAYTYHKRELIASDRALRTPEGALAGDILLKIMNKQPRFSGIGGYYNGGIFDGGMAQRTASRPVLESYDSTQQVIAAIKALPPSQVLVTDIVKKQQENSYVRVTKDLKG